MSVDGRLDNFDQRLTADLQMLLDGLCCVFFGNTNDYIAYPWLFIITRLICAFKNTFEPPDRDPIPEKNRAEIGWMVLVMFLVCCAAYLVPMNVISKKIYRIAQLEGSFHATHAKVIKNAESIAMYNGAAREKAHADSQYAKLHQKMYTYYIVQGVLMFFRVIVTIAQPAICLMLLSLTGANDPSYASAFLKQCGNITEFTFDLPVLVARLAFAAGTAHRVGQLMDAIEVFGKADLKSVAVDSSAAECIRLVNVSASPPTPKFDIDTTKGLISCCNSGATEYGAAPNIFNNLNLQIKKGEHTVIMGPSGCGKSSMLRVIAGLWNTNEGRVERPVAVGKDGLFFLPQRSYLFEGTLLAQVLYPAPRPSRRDPGARRSARSSLNCSAPWSSTTSSSPSASTPSLTGRLSSPPESASSCLLPVCSTTSPCSSLPTRPLALCPSTSRTCSSRPP
jgi:ABC-type uncharacterized transport system fused permease/ATPase subunit